MNIPQLKQLCDFFDVDRSPGPDGEKVDKDVLIDRLLDFLSSPSVELTNTHAKASKKKTSKAKPEASDKAKSGKKGKAGAKKANSGEKAKKEEKEKSGESEASDEEISDADDASKNGGKDDGKDKDDSNDDSKAEKGEDKAKAKPKSKSKESGEIPSDEKLREWVKAYVACFNMESSTLKHAIEVASSKFGVDLSKKKKTIKLMLTEEC